MMTEIDTIQKQSPIDHIPPETMKRWKPGQSGNPNGRPKKVNSITYWYRKLLAEKAGLPAKKIAKMAIEKAQEGSIQHIQEVTDRVDGRVGADIPPAQDNRQYIIIMDGEQGAREQLDKLLRGEPRQLPQDIGERQDED